MKNYVLMLLGVLTVSGKCTAAERNNISPFRLVKNSVFARGTANTQYRITDKDREDIMREHGVSMTNENGKQFAMLRPVLQDYSEQMTSLQHLLRAIEEKAGRISNLTCFSMGPNPRDTHFDDILASAVNVEGAEGWVHTSRDICNGFVYACWYNAISDVWVTTKSDQQENEIIQIRIMSN